MAILVIKKMVKQYKYKNKDIEHLAKVQQWNFRLITFGYSAMAIIIILSLGG